MHKITLPSYAIERALVCRARLNPVDGPDATHTALIVVDLQNGFVIPGPPAEVAQAREIVANVNRLGATSRYANIASAPSHAENAPEAPNMAAAALRILVIEDHPALGRFITAVLSSAGWAVLGPVADHDSAMDAARRLALDLVLIDRLLQGEETLAITDVLAERGIPCVLMSGYPRSTLPERFRDFRFLEKPFTMDALLAAVRAALGGG